tara:strand:+ start:319 stop:498 length:180 start_codon:yes stop_codon:yes gene_type:complete
MTPKVNANDQGGQNYEDTNGNEQDFHITSMFDPRIDRIVLKVYNDKRQSIFNQLLHAYD